MKLLFDVERQELAAQLVPPYRATQVFKSVYHRWIKSFEEMTDLPKTARARTGRGLADRAAADPSAIRFQRWHATLSRAARGQ
jgi:adenine C2-methylase RlmN of 23S rRNA A2503 and tRNA A37